MAKMIINTLRNGMMVEFISGHIVEQFRVHREEYGDEVFYKETTNTKWGAIGIIENKHDGIRETMLIRYRIRIIWNNGKPANFIIGANENNIKKLSDADTEEWNEFINENKQEVE